MEGIVTTLVEVQRTGSNVTKGKET